MKLRKKLKKSSLCIELLKLIQKSYHYLRRNEGDQGYLALYNATNESDLYYILDFVYSFLPKEMKKQKPAHTTWVRSATNPGVTPLGQGLSNPFAKFANNDGKNENVPYLISPENEERIWHILSNQANRKFMIDCFFKQKGVMTNKFRLRLRQDAFNYLANFFIKLTGGIINDKDYDTIARFISLSAKYYTVVSLMKIKYPLICPIERN